MTPFRPVTKRDVFLVIFGASSMYIWSSMFTPGSGINNASILIGSPFLADPSPDLTDEKSRASNDSSPPAPPSPPPATHHHSTNPNQNVFSTPDPLSGPPTTMTSIPHTSIVAHAPGWTIFRNLYMSNGTLLIVSPSSVNAAENFPQIRMMTSPGLPAENTPDDIQRREPTADHMDFITPEQADLRWKISSSSGDDDNGDDGSGDKYRVWSVKGNTVLFNDPSQFLRHFYHFVAELFFGMWAFWFGAFTPSSPQTPLSLSLSSFPSSSTDKPHNPLYAPPIHRVIFAHSDIDGWHDNPGFDAYFFRAAFPSLAVEDQRAWQDRIQATTPRPDDPTTQRAWHFPIVLITDRSAAFKGRVCGSLTQRTAAEAWQYMIERNQLLGVHAARWWDPVREAMWRFASVDGADARAWMKRFRSRPEQFDGAKPAVLDARGPEDDDVLEVDAAGVRRGAFQYLLPAPETITITYISRQRGGRRLTDEGHEDLVASLHEMVERRNEKGEKWLFRVVEAERMSKDEQVRMSASTTILLGVHGNGLTHLVFMPPTRLSTVIEIFYPGGFAHDYHWTSTAMGMRHFAVWNDTYHTLPDEPRVDYPDGFQSRSIPVHGPSVAKMIEDRVDGKV